MRSDTEAYSRTSTHRCSNDQGSPEAPPRWHALQTTRIAELLQTDPVRGLAQAEAERRLTLHGPNRLPQARKKPVWLRLLSQFNNFLIYIMLAAALIMLALAHWIDAAVLFSAVIVNAVLGFIQEGKAESALQSIGRMLSPRATVIRDGVRLEIDADMLVPGDVLVLASGDRVPADARVLGARNLRVDDALLTGESVAAGKNADAVAEDAPLGDRRCMLYSGSLVVSGQATAVVVATGTGTEIGRISTMVGRIEAISTPLLRQMDRFARWLGAVIILLAAATFVLGVLWRGHPPAEMFVMVVALAASAIPEGLPAIMTVTLALGVQRMARRNAIIRRLPAVETLGSVTVICSDKTGTLTRNEMTVKRVVTSDRVLGVTGAGYEPSGAFEFEGHTITAAEDPQLMRIARAALLCSDAELTRNADGWTLAGDPTEGALVAMAMKAGLDPATERHGWPRHDVIPFESEHRFMATLHHDHRGGAVIYLKGAPEQIMEMCSLQEREEGLEPLDRDYWRRQITDAAALGMRMLAIAAKRLGSPAAGLQWSDVEKDCTLMALVGMIDPPREEAIAAVKECHQAGIRVKMITGDHVETARAIGRQLDIGVDKPALTGAEIEVLDDASLRELVEDIDIYARASPEHKLRLVSALQASHHIVAMTGDGVNDAPALKRADIGVAMGRKGTDAAREVADMVLTDDNFATIGNAVREGRGVYENIRKFVLFMLPTNGGEALVVVAAILFELTLPLTAAQVLWINMATSGTLGLALAFEPTEDHLMRRPPRDPRQSLLTKFFVWRLTMVSVLMATGALGLFLLALHLGSDLPTARTMAVNAVVAGEMFYLVNSRSIYGSILNWRGLTGNLYVPLSIAACMMLQILYTYSEPLQRIFGSTPLTAGQWALVAAAGALVFFVAEFEKWVHRRRRSAH